MPKLKEEDAPYMPSPNPIMMDPDLSGQPLQAPRVPAPLLGSRMQPPMSRPVNPQIAQLQSRMDAMDQPQPRTPADVLGQIGRGISFQAPGQFQQQEQQRLGMQFDQEQQKKQALAQRLKMALDQQQQGIQNQRQSDQDRIAQAENARAQTAADQQTVMAPVVLHHAQTAADTADLGLAQAKKAEDANKYQGFSEGQTVVVTDKSGKEVDRFTVPKAGNFQEETAQAWIKANPVTNGHPSTLADFDARPAKPAAPTPPMSPERMSQEKGLAEERAKRLAGNDERLANVPIAQHGKVYADVQKAEDAHTAARLAADTMSTFINLAKAGNKEAYAYSPVAGVLEINTGAGVKRINRQEIDAYAGAGSLFDRIQAAVGKQVSGASLSPSLLNDIQALHNAISTNADTTYKRSLESIDRTYRSTFSGQSQGAAGAGPQPPKVWDIVDGYRYNGGDPAKPTSWVKVP